MFCSETWLTPDTPDSAIQPDGFSVYRHDRHAETTGKAKGGGLCFLVNNSWCTDVEVISRGCSPVLDHLAIKCRLFYSQRELSSVLLTAVYIPPQVRATEALEELYTVISGFEDKYPQAASIVAGDFNHCNLKAILPKYHQHVSCPTRKILHHCYSTMKGAYKSIPRPHFRKLDHSSVLMPPVYKQEIKRAKPIVRTVQYWSEDNEMRLQGCFEETDWAVFQDPLNLDSYADVITIYVWFCMDTCIPTWITRSYPNQKPWMNGAVRRRLEERSVAYEVGDGERYKETRYVLRRTIKAAKGLYRNRLERHHSNGDARRLWRGLQDLMGYKGKASGLSNTIDSFLEERVLRSI